MFPEASVESKSSEQNDLPGEMPEDYEGKSAVDGPRKHLRPRSPTGGRRTRRLRRAALLGDVTKSTMNTSTTISDFVLTKTMSIQ